MRRLQAGLLIFSAVMIISVSPLFSYADQTTSERILEENRHFMEFINVAVTNFGSSYEKQFSDAYRDHFNADVAFLQSDYKRTYKRVYRSQGKLIAVYENILKKYYLEESKSILDIFAPGVVKSKKNKARLYLTLGYRDREVSWSNYIVGEASNPKLYSYKLQKYEKAITIARRAKRYAFLSLFESQKSKTRKEIYLKLISNEHKEKNGIFGVRFLGKDGETFNDELGVSYEEYENKIKNNEIKTNELEKKLERRVRFRKEKRWALYLINNEFAKADEILREYVSDLNFKLIRATFQVLKERKNGPKIDYDRLQVHLMDNYGRLTKESALDGILSSVTVEDSIPVDQNKKEDKTPQGARETGDNKETTETTK